MKTPTIYERGAIRTPQSALRIGSQSGVALVITLILLSIITFMAISFMVLSWSQAGAVNTEKEQIQARLAADAGAQRAMAQLLAPMMAYNNGFNYGLLVTTNYINPYGFNPGGPGFASPTNVNYDYTTAGQPLTRPQSLQNIANLWRDPRAPVFITNRFNANGGYEFRYFLNLNRNTDPLGNALFDPTGWLAVTNLGTYIATATPGIWVSNFFVGDPQWIGVLQFPDRPHAGDNRFLSRFAFFVVPASKTLDLNYIYNYSKNLDPRQMTYANDSFLRNQGTGTGEINLAAFLADLNTNFWPCARGNVADAEPVLPGYTAPTYPNYSYHWHPGRDYTTANSGYAFEDAFGLLRYRYVGSQNPPAPGLPNYLPSVQALYGARGANAFAIDMVDGYSAGPVMLASWPPAGLDPDASPAARTTRPWWGGYNTNHFFTPQELFDRNKAAFGNTRSNLTDRLIAAGRDTNSSYNRYTFYRMAAQLGGESAVESGKMNLNWDNLCYKNALGIASATNFVQWRPVDFFTNAANRLLANAGYSFTVTNIQIFPTNYYTPNVHRLLQLAANIYDATTNQIVTATYPYLPSVFRPIFRRIGTGPMAVIMIAGYREAIDDTVANFVGRRAPPGVALGFNQATIPRYGLPWQQNDSLEPMVLGFPLVIGAKKGLPTFNEFGMQTTATATRKVQFRRLGTGNDTAIVETNLMYMLSITNTCGLEGWNSCSTFYPRPLEMRIAVDTLAYLTNENGTVLLTNLVAGDLLPIQIPATAWHGFTDPSANNLDGSFKAFITNFLFLTNCTYLARSQTFILPTDTFERGLGFYIPHWYLTLRPQVRYALVDTSVNPERIVDYVSLDSNSNPQAPVDLTQLLSSGAACTSPRTPDPSQGGMWCTNRDTPTGMTYGIGNQIDVGDGQQTGAQWPGNHNADIDFLRAQFGLGPMFYPPGTFTMTNTFVCAYAPARQMSFYTSWQANDPLVHYMMADLTDTIGPKPTVEVDTLGNSPMNGLGGNNVLNPLSPVPIGIGPYLNSHYRPWGGNPLNPRETPTIPSNWRLDLKDPLVWSSDYWDFPTNRFPNVGWLGRVHRGTPWQTVYLKSPAVQPSLPNYNDVGVWQLWTGDKQYFVATNRQFLANWNGPTLTNDASFSLPTQDRYILDLFTTSFNENSAVGQMSVNQDGLAAWSALLSGVVVLTNANSDAALRGAYAAHIQPAPPIAQACDPAGPYDMFNTNTWSPLVRIVNGINSARAAYPGGVFQRLGDILAVPELTVASPFLNPGSTMDARTANALIPAYRHGQYTWQYTMGLNDEAYERIPQQVLGLLRADPTPRFVIYSYGQALKPAEHSVVTGGGQYFQLCTNYQISAEVVIRAVAHIDGAPNNPHIVFDSYNVVSPDN